MRRLRGEEGSVAVEAVLAMPLLLLAHLGTDVFFDAYRAQGINAKAAYTLGDALSRETG